MTALAKPQHMTVPEFLTWAEGREGRFELLDGEITAMAGERIDHARSKAAAWLALMTGIKRASIPCEAFVEGVGVVIDDHTLFLPDALVNCGPPVPGDMMTAPNPIIVVEVLSPSPQHIDKTKKLFGYFSLPAVQHYVIIDVELKAAVHHRRAEGGLIITELVREGGVFTFDPPGLTAPLAEMFG